MKLTSSLAIVAIILLSACKNNSKISNEITLINGGKTYGGELVFSHSEIINDLFPYGETHQSVLNITSQIYETLLNIDPTTLKVTPNIASNYSTNDAGNIYKFEINKGIFFHDDDCFGGKGRELTPEDVKFSLDFACSSNSLNAGNEVMIENIKGASSHFAASKNSFPKDGVSGIKVKGSTIEIELIKPLVGFEAILARKNVVIFPKEALEKYGKEIKSHPVGTGPFKLDQLNKDGIRLVRNEHYWQKDAFGNQLPYLSAITVKYFKEKKAEMLAFRNKEIDLLLDIPADEIENVLGTLQEAVEGKNLKHKVESSTSLNIDYLGFNSKEGVFSSSMVREAIYFAIQPQELIETYLGGDGYAPTNGFVPEIEGANNTIKIPAPNTEKARALLAKAGYPNGVNFPKETIYVNALEGSKVHALIVGVTKALKRELNIDLAIQLVSFSEREKLIDNGTAKIWRSGWVADYPSPISFLELFQSTPEKPNKFKYENAEFNSNFQAALIEKDPRKRGFHFIKAQSIILEDAVVVPLLVDNMLVMVNARIKGITANQIEQINFKEVFIKEPRVD